MVNDKTTVKKEYSNYSSYTLMKLLSLLFLGVISLTHSLLFLTFPTDSAEVWPSSFIDFPSSSRGEGEVAGSRVCRHPELLGTGGRLQYFVLFSKRVSGAAHREAAGRERRWLEVY